MKFLVLVSTIALSLVGTNLFAQHSDVEFGYDDTGAPTSVIVEDFGATNENILFFESELDELDPFDPGNFSSDEPGFVTNDADSLLINENDQVFVTALDATMHSMYGVGYVNYHDGNAGSGLQAAGRLAVQDNSTGTADLILNGAGVESGPGRQFLGLGDVDGDLHDHIVIDLLDDASAPLGAYGVLFQIESDLAAGGTIESEPFWIIWNHGLTEDEFENNVLPAFGVTAVPEPGSLGFLAAAAATLYLRRRRKRE